MARLTITAHARADLQEIYSHIAKDKPEAAGRFVERLRTKARQLAETPGMGRSRGEDLRPDLFSFPIGQYILSTASGRAGSYSFALFTAAAIYLPSFSAAFCASSVFNIKDLVNELLRNQAPGCAGAVFRAVRVALPPLFRRLDAENPVAPTDPPSPKPRKRRLTPRKRSATSAAKKRIHQSDQ